MNVAANVDLRSETTPPPISPRHVAVKPPASGGSLTREQFLLPEIRKVALLRIQGATDDEIIERVKSENLFQYPTTRMVGNIAKVCIRRLNMLAQPQFTAMLAEGAGYPDRAAQINLYAMARTYRLMRDFLEVEIASRFLMLDYQFGPPEMNAYFSSLTARSREAAAWSDATIYKLKQVLRTSLRATGLLSNGAPHQLQLILLDPDVRAGMAANDDYDLLPAFSCTDAIW